MIAFSRRVITVKAVALMIFRLACSSALWNLIAPSSPPQA